MQIFGIFNVLINFDIPMCYFGSETLSFGYVLYYYKTYVVN